LQTFRAGSATNAPGVRHEGGARHGPPTPHRAARPGGAAPRLDCARAPRNGPHTPQRASRPGGAVARLDCARAPRNGPHTPSARHAPAGAVALLDLARVRYAAMRPPMLAALALALLAAAPAGRA